VTHGGTRTGDGGERGEGRGSASPCMGYWHMIKKSYLFPFLGNHQSPACRNCSAPWCIHIGDITDSYVWHDAFICVTWVICRILTRDMTYSYAWHSDCLFRSAQILVMILQTCISTSTHSDSDVHRYAIEVNWSCPAMKVLTRSWNVCQHVYLLLQLCTVHTGNTLWYWRVPTVMYPPKKVVGDMFFTI